MKHTLFNFLMTGNLAIQCYFLDGSIFKGMLSMFGPVLFSRKRLVLSNTESGNLRSYLWTNIIFNLFIHISMWFTMTFLVCWGVRSNTNEFVWGIGCILSDENVARKFHIFLPTILLLNLFLVPITFILQKVDLYRNNPRIDPKIYMTK